MKNFFECKKLGYLIKIGVQRNVTAIYNNEHDKVREEYGKIVKEYVAPKYPNAILDEVWNVYTKKTTPHLVVGKNSIRKKEGAVRQGKKMSQGSLQRKEK